MTLDGRFVVVDSHPRSPVGLYDAGKSVILHFSCLDDLHHYIVCLAHTIGSKKNELFELWAFNISVMSEKADVSPVQAGISIPTNCTDMAPVVASLTKHEVPSNSESAKTNWTEWGHFDADNYDVQFVGVVSIEKMTFSPLTADVSKKLCKKLDVTCQASKQVGLLGSPCKNESIVGDGNRFFVKCLNWLW